MHIAHVDEVNKRLLLVDEFETETDDGGTVLAEHHMEVDLKDLEGWANALGYRLVGNP